MDRHKIVLLDHTPFVGGAQLALVRHLNALDLSKFDPVVVCGDPQFFRTYLRPERHLDIKIIRHRFGRLKPFGLMSSINIISSSVLLVRLLVREGPDLVVVNTERCLYAVWLAVLVTKIPAVVFVRDFEFSKRLLAVVKRQVTNFICVSRSVRDHYFASSDQKASVVYVGTDLTNREDFTDQRGIVRLKSEFGIKEEFIIGFVGRLVSWKGPLILPEIARILFRTGSNLPSWRIVVVGDGVSQEGSVDELLRKRLKDLDLERPFSLVGFSKEVATWYQIFSVLLHTSQEAEPFATVVVEALTSGLPVIATDLGGTREIIVNDQNGFLVEYRAEAFAQTILRLMEDHGLYRSLRRGAELSSRKFRESEITREIEGIYLKALGAPRA